MTAVILAAGSPFGIGHNNGPPLDQMPGWHLVCWRKAHRRAWRNPPKEVIRRRALRAEEAGMTYREYSLVIMDRGKWL